MQLFLLVLWVKISVFFLVRCLFIVQGYFGGLIFLISFFSLFNLWKLVELIFRQFMFSRWNLFFCGWKVVNILQILLILCVRLSRLLLLVVKLGYWVLFCCVVFYRNGQCIGVFVVLMLLGIRQGGVVLIFSLVRWLKIIDIVFSCVGFQVFLGSVCLISV